MVHEFKQIIQQAFVNQEKGLKNVLATVVFLDGSSYRKPGVRMLICENGSIVGAVSGGCVENEVKGRSLSVLLDDKAKVMTYDGRYRLGCEGMLYILIEPFHVSFQLLQELKKSNELRESIQINSYFQKKDECLGNFGSIIQFKNNTEIKFSNTFNLENPQSLELFSQTLKPPFKLLIIGGEHDAVKLCAMASLLGWEVNVTTSIKDPKKLPDFSGAKTVIAHTSETIDLQIDNETAVVLMTHNYVQDLKYLLKFVPLNAKYIGIIGSTKRREQLHSELMHYVPELSESFLDSIYSPAGLHIGAITPEEIALSILAEILSVYRQTKSESLRSFSGKTKIQK